jgi:hypothetical protein
MSSISKTKLAHILCCLSLSILGSLVLADVNATAYEGKIFINLYDSDNFSEYELAAGNLVKTIDGKVSRFEKDGRTYSTSWTEAFKRLYYSKRIYRYDMEEKQAVFFSPYDLQRLQDIQARFFRHSLFGEEPEITTRNLYLAGPGRKPKYFINFTYHFFPNRQFTHVVHGNSSGALINAETKGITFPFGIDTLEHNDWSSTGQFFAYSFQGYKSKYILGDRPAWEIKDRDQATLVIVDVSTEKTLLRKNLGERYIVDLAWSSDSSHIGVIIVTPRLGVWPWELLAAMAGHPIYHNTYRIEVYDLKGNMVESKDFEGSYKLGSARIVWD